MTEQQQPSATPSDTAQDHPQDLQHRLEHVERSLALVEHENKTLRHLIEAAIANRQKSHSELVLLLTNLVSKTQINEAGIIISKLIEHNTNVTQYLAALAKGTAEAPIPEPTLLENLDNAKKKLAAAIGPEIQELLRLETPIESKLLDDVARDPDVFFSQPATRAWRCFLKGQIPRERILREFGEPSLCCFRDMTTDPRRNPRPKPEEIVLAFKEDVAAALSQDAALGPDQKQTLQVLMQRVQKSKGTDDVARAQRTAFQKLSFYVELLHYYQHQNTESPEVIFAQRLPSLVEQLAASQADLDERSIIQVEELLAHIINPDHRQMVINNVGKGGGVERTLKYVLTFRTPKVEAPENVAADFMRHLLPAQGAKPMARAQLTPVLRLMPEPMQRVVLRALTHTDRMRKDEAEALALAAAAELGIKTIDEGKPKQQVLPEVEREMAWNHIKDMVAQRKDHGTLAGAIRERLNAHYDSEEIRQSWMVLTEADPMTFIRVFCQLPYLPNGKTDPISKPVMESYLTRLLHEKYASIYHRVLVSLKNIYKAKHDSPTLLTFMALVKWASPEAATRITADIGMPAGS